MSKWIKCSEQLPPVNEKVIFRFFLKDGCVSQDGLSPSNRDEIRVGTLNDTHSWFITNELGDGCNKKYVTHWMPLPDAPEEE